MVNEQSSSSSSQISDKSNAIKPKGFQPRAGVQRKTKAERDQYAKQEAERQQGRLGGRDRGGEVSRSTTTSDNAGRGRGSTASNRGGRVRIGKPGVGVFGSGSPSRSSAKSKDILASSAIESEPVGVKLPAEQIEPETKETLTNVQTKAEKQSLIPPKAEGSKVAKKPGGTLGISSSEESDEEGRDIEMIWISSDEEDQEVVSNKGKQRQFLQPQRPNLGLRPIRAPKTTIEEQEETSLPRPKPSRIATKKSVETEIHDVDTDEMIIDDPEILKEPLQSPDQRRKYTKKPSSRIRDTKAAETAEERSERLRLNDDIQKMREEFLGSTATNDVTASTTASKYILFQFPPITPFLIDPQAQVSTTEIKTEPNTEGPSSTNASATTVPPLLPPTATNIEVKKGPEIPPPNHSSIPPNGTLTPSSIHSLPQGQIGKLKIHKSGKVTLDWGGTNMEVRYGTEVDFLQDAVFLDSSTAANTEEFGDENNDHDNEINTDVQGESSKGKAMAYALGQVRKKMVVIPDWSRLYD